MSAENVVSAETLLGQLATAAATEMSATGVPGVALGVVSGGRPASIGLGVRSLAEATPVTPATLFRLCSLTKPMVSTLAWRLDALGALDLDAPVRTYLPDLPVAAADVITCRHLMLHTSGLECELPGGLDAYGGNDDALDRMVGDYALLRQFAAPGQLWGYCNTGYWMLGAVIARVTKVSFEDAMTEYLLAPLGMRDCVFDADDAILRPVALPHRPVEADHPRHEPVSAFAFPRARRPSGGLIASVDDLLRFATLHLGHPPDDSPVRLGDDELSTLHTPVVESFAPMWQSLAWVVEHIFGRSVLLHGGSHSGYNTWLSLIPEFGVAIAVLTNSSAGRTLIRAVDDAARSALLGWAPRPPRFVDVPAERLARFAGTYGYPGLDTIEVRAAEGGLTVLLPEPGTPGGTRAPRLFRPMSETEFAEPNRDRAGADLTLLPDAHTGIMRLRLGNRLGIRKEQQ